MTTEAAAIHVKVRAGGETYALPVSCVREVAERGDLAPLPGSPPALLGVRNVHGQVLPVIDLASALGLGGEAPALRVVVAECDGVAAGLAVDEVLDVGELRGTRAEPDSEHFSEAVLEEGALVGVVRLDRIFAALAAGSP